MDGFCRKTGFLLVLWLFSTDMFNFQELTDLDVFRVRGALFLSLPHLVASKLSTWNILELVTKLGSNPIHGEEFQPLYPRG